MQEFIREYHAELNRQRNEAELCTGTKRRELDGIARKLSNLIDAIAEGIRSSDLQRRLDEFSRRKTELEIALAADAAPLPRLHPNLAKLYRQKVEHLHSDLAAPATHAAALEILRGLIERVVVRHNEHGFEIELFGEIANMMALSTGAESPKDERFRSSVKVVAGERCHREYPRLRVDV